jgi:hypothetical protein
LAEDDGEDALLDSADAGEDGLQDSAQTVDDVDVELDLENMARTNGERRTATSSRRIRRRHACVLEKSKG